MLSGKGGLSASWMQWRHEKSEAQSAELRRPTLHEDPVLRLRRGQRAGGVRVVSRRSYGDNADIVTETKFRLPESEG